MTSYNNIARNATTYSQVPRLDTLISPGSPIGLLLALTYSTVNGLTTYSTTARNATTYSSVARN